MQFYIEVTFLSEKVMISRSTTKALTVGAMLTALALIFSYIEFLIPLSIGIPGIKLGFANIVIVYSLYKLGPRHALMVDICRVLLSGLLFGSVFSTLYAMAGALLSLLGMLLLKKTDVFTTAGVSVAGGVLHNLGQIIVAVFVVETAQVFAYFPVLVFSGIITGAINGIISTLCLKKTEKVRI